MSELIEKLLAKLDIKSLVGFDGHGANPIHGSSTGMNLSVNSSKNEWFCFSQGCKKGGGPLQWIASQLNNQCIDRVDNWKQVLQEACRITGVEYQNNQTEDQQNLQSVYNHITNYYHKKLLENKDIISYVMDKWGYTREDIKQLKIGYAPLHYDFTKTFNKKLLLKTGIFYDNLTPHFRMRIVIPYLIDGQPRYFIARKIDGHTRDDMGKYIKLLQYSKKKSRTYVSKDVKEPILRSSTIFNSDYVVITEGIADYYSLILNNIPAITPVTISFKDKDYYRLKKYIAGKEIYICNDAEDNHAGLEGAIRMLQFIPHAKIVLLPRTNGVTKVDVNDYFKYHNTSDFKQLMEEAVNGYHYLATKELAYIPLEDIELKQIKQLVVSYLVTEVNENNPMYILKAKKDTDNNKILYYQNGTYQIDLGDQWITKKITQYLNKQNMNIIELSPNSITNIINKVKYELLATKPMQISEDLNRFNKETSNEILINVLNGVIQIDKTNDYKIQLLPHHSNYMFRSKLQVEYYPDFEEGQAQLYHDTIKDILQNDEDVTYWLMEMAYLFVPSSFLQHIPHIVGIGNTGKSTILRPIEKLFDPEFVADTRLSLLIDNDYGTGNLYDIDLLSINEIDKDPTKGLEILKSLGTMETETLNPKYVTMIKNYQIKNKTVMRSNHYLKLKDSSEKRRVFVFRAHTKFDKSKVDPDRETKLLQIKNEIFNYILQYMKPLYETRLELKSMTVERYEKHYKLYGDPIRTYLRICTTQADHSVKYTVEELQEYYNIWAEDVGFDNISSIRVFGGELTKLAEESTTPLFDVSQKIRMELEDERGIKVRRVGWKGIDFTNQFRKKYMENNNDTEKKSNDISKDLDKYF